VRVSFISSALPVPEGAAAGGLLEALAGAAAAGFAVFFLGAAAGRAVVPVFGIRFSS
jgi:hypothetical protein